MLSPQQNKFLKNSPYLRFKIFSNLWPHYQKCPPLSALQASTQGRPLVFLSDPLPSDFDGAPLRSKAIILADCHVLAQLKRLKCLPHLWYAPPSLHEYYEHVHHLKSLGTSVCMINHATPVSVCNRIRNPVVRIDEEIPNLLDNLGQEPLFDAHRICALLGCVFTPLNKINTLPQLTPIDLTDVVASLSPVVPSSPFAVTSAPVIQGFIQELSQHLENIYRFLYLETLDRILQGEGGEARMRAKYTSFFHELAHIISQFKGRLPSFIPAILACEDQLLEESLREMKEDMAWNEELESKLLCYVYWFQGCLYWLNLIACSL